MNRVIVGKNTAGGRAPLAVRRTRLPIPAIRVGELRVRGVDETIVRALMDSIARVGLRQRILIGPENVLIAGLQRLEALTRLGYELVPVEILNLSEVERQIVEIDENLVRGELDGWARVRALTRQKELYLLQHPETGAGGARRGLAFQSNAHSAHLKAPTFTHKTVQLTGKNRATIDRAVQLGDAFAETQIEILEEAGVAPTRALDIARLAKPERDTVVARLQAEGSQQLREILGPHYGKALGDRRGIGARRAEEWRGVEDARSPLEEAASEASMVLAHPATDATGERAAPRPSSTAPRSQPPATDKASAGETQGETHRNGDSERPPQFNVPALPRAAGRELAARFNRPGERILLVKAILKGHPEEIRETVLSLLDDWSHTEEEMLDLFFEVVGLSVVHMKDAFLARLDALHRNPTRVLAGKHGR